MRERPVRSPASALPSRRAKRPSQSGCLLHPTCLLRMNNRPSASHLSPVCGTITPPFPRAGGTEPDDHRRARPLHHRAGGRADFPRHPDRGDGRAGQAPRQRQRRPDTRFAGEQPTQTAERARHGHRLLLAARLLDGAPLRRAARQPLLDGSQQRRHQARLRPLPRPIHRRLLPPPVARRPPRRRASSRNSSAPSTTSASSDATSTPTPPAATGPTRRSATATGIPSTRRWSSWTFPR